MWRSLSGPYTELEYFGISTRWQVVSYTEDAQCYKSWRQSGDNPCLPTEAYIENTCVDDGCPDTDSCENSAGATCVISE